MGLAYVFRFGIELAFNFVLAPILHSMPRGARGYIVPRDIMPLNRAARRVARFRVARECKARPLTARGGVARGASIVARGVAF